MSKDIRRRMSEAHEAHLAEVLNGVRSRGSGNQAANPADGRQDHHLNNIAFSWDCKSTLGKSLSIKLSDWEKIKDQSHGERPMLPIRMYMDDRLMKWVDLVVLDLADLEELLDEIARGDQALENLFNASKSCLQDKGTLIQVLRDNNAQLVEEVKNLEQLTASLASRLPESYI